MTIIQHSWDIPDIFFYYHMYLDQTFQNIWYFHDSVQDIIFQRLFFSIIRVFCHILCNEYDNYTTFLGYNNYFLIITCILIIHFQICVIVMILLKIWFSRDFFLCKSFAIIYTCRRYDDYITFMRHTNIFFVLSNAFDETFPNICYLHGSVEDMIFERLIIYFKGILPYIT